MNISAADNVCSVVIHKDELYRVDVIKTGELGNAVNDSVYFHCELCLQYFVPFPYQTSNNEKKKWPKVLLWENRRENITSFIRAKYLNVDFF